jgi:hypothetical protein
MARRFQDDDYDDRPRRRRPADDNDDVDERISSRKQSGSRARGDDYDDDYDDRPRKRKKAGSKGLVIGLSVGGAVLVLAVVGIVLFLVLKGGGGGDTQKLIVGTWQMTDAGPFALRAEFTADGRFIEDMALLKLQHKYKVINASTIEVEMGNPFQGMPGVPGNMPMPNVKRTITVNVTQNELTLTEQGLVKRYRRVN